MKYVIGFVLALPAFAFAGSTSLQFVQPAFGSFTAQRAIPLANGQTLVVASQPLFAFLDSAGNRVYYKSVALGSGTNSIADAAVDNAGNIWIAGNTNSDDFPLLHPVVSTKAPYVTTGFITKLDPTASTILFSTLLGGTQGGTSITAITLDTAGNVYVTGGTYAPDFPSTVPVLGFGGPTYGNLINLVPAAEYAFVTKVSADGQTILYSVFVGGGNSLCPSEFGIPCGPSTVGTSIALDSSSNVTLGGFTNAGDSPVTAHAFQSYCSCQMPSLFYLVSGFISRISSDAKTLIWSTYLGSVSQEGDARVQAIAVDGSGTVYVSGNASGGFPVTAGALQQVDNSLTSVENVFAAKLSSDGSALLYGTYLGGTNGATLSGIQLDNQGNPWVTGTTTSPDFPTIPGTIALGNAFALELNSTDTALQQIFRLPTGVTNLPPSFDQSGNLILLSSVGSVLKLDVTTRSPAQPFLPSPTPRCLPRKVHQTKA